MMYLLDTNLISELRKGERANQNVRNWFADTVAHRQPTYVSVITIGEIRGGITRLQNRGDSSQAAIFDQWLQTLIIQWRGRMLPFGLSESLVWGQIAANGQNLVDKQIAATAIVHDLTVATRNERDFADLGALVTNPFQ